MNFEALFNDTKAVTGASYPKLDAEGTYTVRILSSEFVKTLAGNASQGKLQVEVVEGEKAGARVNLYVGAGKTNEQGLRNSKFLWETLKGLGISSSKLEEDCDSLIEVIQNLVQITAKRVLKGEVILLTLHVRKNTAKSTDLKTEFYYNPAVYTTSEATEAAISEISKNIPTETDPFFDL